MARQHHLLCVVLLAAAGLSACGSTPLSPGRGDGLLPTEQWISKVAVEEQPRSIQLAQHQLGLSAAQREALTDFTGQWRAENGGAVSVIYPGGSEVPLVARQSAAMLHDAGIGDVRLLVLDRGAIGDPVVVQYSHAEAVLPVCGRAISDYMATRNNGVDPNFGCAVTANLAAQAADPRDLQRPRANDPADGARAAVIVGKYQQGQDTGSAAPSGFGSGQTKAVN
ncbi:MAG: pilus (Caulobacter type) biosis lipoprotein CpaD [Caulobacteraceae bacterium]|nr:pilus (Caulobacter type) biosis lipoprotein CpaD [Caulobacteraceae bacterium]